MPGGLVATRRRRGIRPVPALVSSPSSMKSRPASAAPRTPRHGVGNLARRCPTRPHTRAAPACARRASWDSFRAPPHRRHPQAVRGRGDTREARLYPARYLRSDGSAAGEGGAAGRLAPRRGVQLRPRCGDDGHARWTARQRHRRRDDNRAGAPTHDARHHHEHRPVDDGRAGRPRALHHRARCATHHGGPPTTQSRLSTSPRTRCSTCAPASCSPPSVATRSFPSAA